MLMIRAELTRLFKNRSLILLIITVERHIKYTKKIKLNARRHNVKFRSIQII